MGRKPKNRDNDSTRDKKNAMADDASYDDPLTQYAPDMDQTEMYYPDAGGGDATPFDKAYSALTITRGPLLQTVSRTTPKMVTAESTAYVMSNRWRSNYIRGKMETMERLSIAAGGKGRAEIVQIAQAGSGVSDGFYNKPPDMSGYAMFEDETPPTKDGPDGRDSY